MTTISTAAPAKYQPAADPLAARERVPLRVFDSPAAGSRYVADEIAQLISRRQDEGKPAVLGLATGSTPVSVYNQLIRRYREEGLSFRNVVTFNLDEYFPMQPHELQSYMRFMKENLFDHIDIPAENVHIPDGTLSSDQVPAYCAAYEQAIKDAGGIDIQLLGIGRTGHVGFNEPGSGKGSATRLIWLDKLTRLDAASDFFGIEHVPTRAITMGVVTILAARRLILMGWGESKAPIIAEAAEGPVTPAIAASFLQEHPHAEFVVDEAAGAKLTRLGSPWLLDGVELHWHRPLIRKAVIWLAQATDKPILKLTDKDYNEHGLQSLVAAHGPAYNINIDAFRYMQSTITGWPAGKPPELRRRGDAAHASGDGGESFPKRILIFSPHPDDDVISMGGTLIRLADQGHEVHVAYQVSGSIAVFDDDAIRFADFAADFNRAFGIDSQKTRDLEDHVEQFLKNKQAGQIDSEQIQQIKTLIRRGEARAAGRAAGIADMDRLHFMDMPFYETGTVRKKPLGEEDVKITVELLRKIKPHQVYAAGDLSDPHGTHRTCLAAVTAACRELRDEAWFKQTQVWLYRGAWQEWGPEQIEMAVPLSPDELLQKRAAIFKHESQKDRALFPGVDPREFWQRAEDRNRATAELYDRLGLAEYEAIEGFVRWDDDAAT